MVGAALSVLVVLGACAPPPPPTGPTVGIYGDSMSFQASPWSDARLTAAGADVVAFRFPGLAACDLVDSVRKHLARHPSERPDVIVVSTVGNSFTPCMRLPGGDLAVVGSTEFFELYRSAIGQIAQAATDAEVPFVFTWGPSSSPFLPGWTGERHLGLIAAEVALAHPGMVVRHIGAVVLDDQDRYRVHLPCGPGDTPALGCVDGMIRIRVSESDGHFHCAETQLLPTGWPRACPVDSPGARRYGHELARVALEQLGPGSR
jgi:hypothetical protein